MASALQLVSKTLFSGGFASAAAKSFVSRGFATAPEHQMAYPKKVSLGDITIRDGYQHEEKYIPADAKVWVAENLIQAGYKKVEVTNMGNPKRMPQFGDADEVLQRIRSSKKIQDQMKDVELTAITIRESAVERAIKAKEEGWGPDRILFMVSTSEEHHKKNSGSSLDYYWKMAEDLIPSIHKAGIKVCGTVSTIWGCPIMGPTELDKAVDFTKKWLDIGADDIEHADHDGSAPPHKVYEYFSKIMKEIPDPTKHIAHFHVTRGWGLANVAMALQTGITHFESTLGGLGGQPANFVSGVPVGGTGKYYYVDPNNVGLVCTEDMVVMMDEMGIEHGLDVDRVLEIGKMNERIVGRRLRSECVINGRIPKHMRTFK